MGVEVCLPDGQAVVIEADSHDKASSVASAILRAQPAAQVTIGRDDTKGRLAIE